MKYKTKLFGPPDWQLIINHFPWFAVILLSRQLSCAVRAMNLLIPLVISTLLRVDLLHAENGLRVPYYDELDEVKKFADNIHWFYEQRFYHLNFPCLLWNYGSDGTISYHLDKRIGIRFQSAFLYEQVKVSQMVAWTGSLGFGLDEIK